MKLITSFPVCAAALLLGVPIMGCAPQQVSDTATTPEPRTEQSKPTHQPAEEEPFGYATYCMEEELPVVLLKAEQQGESVWKRIDPYDDSQSCYGIRC